MAVELPPPRLLRRRPAIEIQLQPGNPNGRQAQADATSDHPGKQNETGSEQKQLAAIEARAR